MSPRQVRRVKGTRVPEIGGRRPNGIKKEGGEGGRKQWKKNVSFKVSKTETHKQHDLKNLLKDVSSRLNRKSSTDWNNDHTLSEVSSASTNASVIH